MSKIVALLLPLLIITGCSCNRVFFYPSDNITQSPERGGVEYENVYIRSTDSVTLHGWLLKTSNTVKGRILFLHGNAQNVSKHIANVYWLTDHGYEVFMVDYRGYGWSTGRPCIDGLIEDVEKAYDWLQYHNADGLPLYIMGQSLGASLASFSVGNHPEWKLEGVILDAPFSGYQDIVQEKAASSWLTWLIQYPVSRLFSDQYSPKHNIHNISPRPLLLFSSRTDIVVPNFHSERLYELAKQPKYSVVSDLPHIATFNQLEYRELLLKFLENKKI